MGIGTPEWVRVTPSGNVVHCDSEGKKRRLSVLHVGYLRAAAGGAGKCDGGLYSNVTVRLLERLGLVTVTWGPRSGRGYWRMTGVTPSGAVLLRAWDDAAGLREGEERPTPH